MNLLKCETIKPNIPKWTPCVQTIALHVSWYSETFYLHNMRCLVLSGHKAWYFSGDTHSCMSPAQIWECPEFHDLYSHCFLFMARAVDVEIAQRVRPSPLALEVFSTWSWHCGMQRLENWTFPIGFSTQTPLCTMASWANFVPAWNRIKPSKLWLSAASSVVRWIPCTATTVPPSVEKPSAIVAQTSWQISWWTCHCSKTWVTRWTADWIRQIHPNTWMTRIMVQNQGHQRQHVWNMIDWYT